MSLARRRRKARIALLQSLFEWQWHERPADLSKTIQWLEGEGNLAGADREFFTATLTSITEQFAELDEQFLPHLDRELAELGGVELAALRAGTHELLHYKETARAIVINEWVELTKRFGATASFKYINGVLDKVADSVRSGEWQDRDN